MIWNHLGTRKSCESPYNVKLEMGIQCYANANTSWHNLRDPYSHVRFSRDPLNK